MTKVLGLSGKAGSGKDYVADLFETVFLTSRIAFADAVRDEVAERFPELDPYTKPYPDEVRSLLQWWGTEFRRSQDPDYWVARAMERLDATLSSSPPELVVFTDVRFANEAEAIRERGGFVAEIIASPAVRKDRLGKLPPDHASERIDFRVDGVIINNRQPILDTDIYDFFGLPHSWPQPFALTGE